MKKITLIISALFIVSCSTNTNNTTTTSTTDTISKVAQISTTIAQISSILGGLNLNESQTSFVKQAISNYATNYIKTDKNISNYANIINNYKNNTLNSIEKEIGNAKYEDFYQLLEKANNSNKNSKDEITTKILSSLLK